MSLDAFYSLLEIFSSWIKEIEYQMIWIGNVFSTEMQMK